MLLVASQCASCELADIEIYRRDVEKAFSSKSFLGVAEKYGDSKLVEVILENEYDEDNPTVVRKFNSISEFSEWFLEKHQFNENMILPAPVVCRDHGCRYQLPELALHHGTYLLGFDTTKVGRCTLLTRIHIHWG